MLSRADERGVYDRIQNEWALGAAGERLSAISAVYLAASYSHFGQFFCEMTFDGGSLVTPPEAMNLAETWAGTALVHVGATDFALPVGLGASWWHAELSTVPGPAAGSAGLMPVQNTGKSVLRITSKSRPGPLHTSPAAAENCGAVFHRVNSSQIAAEDKADVIKQT